MVQERVCKQAGKPKKEDMDRDGESLAHFDQND